MLNVIKGDLEDNTVLDSLAELDEKFSNFSTSTEFYKQNFKCVYLLVDSALDNIVIGYLGIKERYENERREYVISSIVIAGSYDYREAAYKLIASLPNLLKDAPMVCTPNDIVLLEVLRDNDYIQRGSLLNCEFSKGG